MAAGMKKTWRVRGIDLRCTDLCLQQLAQGADDSSVFQVDSLATEHHRHSQTATISFAQQTTPPNSLGPCPDHHGKRRVQLALDDHFLGFTTLFAPPDEDHQIDIIAISGLGSHAFGSFKERGGEHMWLRDALPDHLVGQQSRRPMARVMIFGYDSRVAGSNSMQNVGDIAGSLRLALTAVVSDDSPRPILLISHSLGGLVVKEAMIALAAARGDEGSEKLLRAIYGLVFFGVPHLGMDNTSLIPMADLGPNLELVVSISQKNSHFLNGQNREFPGALKALGGEVFCFYETQKSPTAQRVSGEWKMTGPEAILVSEASATACVLAADNRVHVCAIDRPHSAIVKYAQQDEAYNLVLSKLQSLAKKVLRHAVHAGGVGAEQGAAHVDRRPHVVCSIPMRENVNFTGRESVLTMLREVFFTKNANEKRRSTIALVGLGGIGKTQVALAFSYWVKTHMPDISIFWMSALSLDTFNQSCASILRDLGVRRTSDEQQDAKQQLKDHLSQNPKASSWLLILDNADDITLLEDTPTRLGLCRYLPFHDKGITLITTRTEDAARTMVSNKEIFNLDLLDPAEARILLEKSFSDERPADYSEKSSKQLLDALEMLPLAITQAAAYLSRNQVSIQQYLGFLQGRLEEAVQLLSREFNLAEKWPPERQHYAVMTTWLVSLDAIKKDDRTRNNSDAAIKLLMFLSQVEPKAIPLSMLPEVGGSVEVLMHTIGTLLKYSLLTKRNGNVYDMHSLVHLAIRSWVSQEKLVDQAMREALDHLEKVMHFHDSLARTVWTAYMPHALRALGSSGHLQADGRFLLACRVSWCLQQDGRFDDALEWAVVGNDGMATIHPPDSEHCLDAKRGLAEAYNSASQPAAALPIYQEVVVGCKRRKCAADDMLLVQARLGIALAYITLRQPRRAINVCIDILDSVTPKHPAHSVARFYIARAYSKIGEHQKAIKHFEYVAAIESKTLPQEHDNRLVAEHELAYEYLYTHQVQRALPLLEHVLSVQLKTLPLRHPNLLEAQHTLAWAHLTNGDPTAAFSLLEQLLETEKKPSTQATLGKAHLAMANVDKAVAVLSDVVQSTQALSDHQWVRLDALRLLQDVFNAIGDTEDAARLDADIKTSRALWFVTVQLETEEGSSSAESSSSADDEDQVRHPSSSLLGELEIPSGQDNLLAFSTGEERPSKRRRRRSTRAAQQDNSSQDGNPQQFQPLRRSARLKQGK
ncbi:protein SERAC1 [Microdochium nivale]|nr:protein SERAC1 [Microdochium nivale]